MHVLLIHSGSIHTPIHYLITDCCCFRFFFDFGCRKAIVLQIKDRPGFEHFLRRLTILGLNFSIEPLSQEVYDSTNQHISKCCLSSDDSNSWLQYRFKANLIDLDNQLDIAQSTSSDRLIRTSIEAFVVLTITNNV